MRMGRTESSGVHDRRLSAGDEAGDGSAASEGSCRFGSEFGTRGSFELNSFVWESCGENATRDRRLELELAMLVTTDGRGDDAPNDDRGPPGLAKALAAVVVGGGAAARARVRIVQVMFVVASLLAVVAARRLLLTDDLGRSEWDWWCALWGARSVEAFR